MDTCADVGLSRATPAVVEVSSFAMAGASRDRTAWSATAGGGGELTFGGAAWRGFPSGRYGPENGVAELRAGVWGQVTTRAHGVVYEVGPKVHLGALYHASWGTFDLRPAIGTGAFASGRSAVMSLGLGYGIRSEPDRYYDGGACVGPHGLYDISPPKKPAPIANASVIRIVGTIRRATDLGTWEVVLGIEISPTWALPPYAWSRLIGARP